MTSFTVAKEREQAFGVFCAIAGADGAIGLLIGGHLTHHLHRACNFSCSNGHWRGAKFFVVVATAVVLFCRISHVATLSNPNRAGNFVENLPKPPAEHQKSQATGACGADVSSPNKQENRPGGRIH